MGGLTGNTLDSHRLAAHALEQGGEAMQDALMEVTSRHLIGRVWSPAHKVDARSRIAHGTRRR